MDFPSNISLKKDSQTQFEFFKFDVLHPWSTGIGSIGFNSSLLRQLMLELWSRLYRYCRCSIAMSGIELSEEEKKEGEWRMKKNGQTIDSTRSELIGEIGRTEWFTRENAVSKWTFERCRLNGIISNEKRRILQSPRRQSTVMQSCFANQRILLEKINKKKHFFFFNFSLLSRFHCRLTDTIDNSIDISA